MFKFSSNGGVSEIILRLHNETIAFALLWANIAIAAVYVGLGWVMFGLASAYFVTTVYWCKFWENKRKVI